MKYKELFILMHKVLVFLLIICGCTYSVPENNSEKEYSTPSPLVAMILPDADLGQTRATYTPGKYGESPSRERENNSPVGDFCIVPDSVFYVGMNIFFDASSSSDPDGDYLEYYWDFGDGSHIFGPTPHNPVCHTYLIKGEYIIRLTVLDNSGKFSIKEKLIHIRES